jgi:hypothetical protein
LLEHLHPRAKNLKLYIGGGSFGTVEAQILYGALYNFFFLLGRRIAGLLLVARLSPFRPHITYTKDVAWLEYRSIFTVDSSHRRES